MKPGALHAKEPATVVQDDEQPAGSVQPDHQSATVMSSDEELLRSLWPGLVRLGRLLSGSEHRAEDMAQEAIAGMLRNAPVAEPRAYLWRSMVNQSVNAGRRAVYERRYLSTLREEVIAPPEVDELWPLVLALPLRQRAVLVLRYYEDLSELEIAKVLECRPGTVKSLASRALAHLRQELDS